MAKFVADSGFAHSLLHHGPKVTSRIEGAVDYDDISGLYLYRHALSLTPGNQLKFDEESVEYVGQNTPASVSMHVSASDAEASSINAWLTQGHMRVLPLCNLFKKSRPFHFYDTSGTAGFRLHVYSHDSAALAPDGRTLAAVLARLQITHEKAYKRIVSTIRLIAPYFGEFDFKATDPYVVLNWRENGSDVLFGPHQISDGTLRAMCLITLLMLPDDQLPSIIIVDEPELGLHPYAIETIASLFKSASLRTQVLISTQSPTFLDQFDAEDVIVVDRIGKESRFSRPDADELNEWLERYSLGEVWIKNAIGGGPV